MVQACSSLSCRSAGGGNNYRASLGAAEASTSVAAPEPGTAWLMVGSLVAMRIRGYARLVACGRPPGLAIEPGSTRPWAPLRHTCSDVTEARCMVEPEQYMGVSYGRSVDRESQDRSTDWGSRLMQMTTYPLSSKYIRSLARPLQVATIPNRRRVQQLQRRSFLTTLLRCKILDQTSSL